jgi:NADH:ubiquinone oxidoreductase subunit E
VKSTALPIRLCTKKKCWKNGGKELWYGLEREIDESGLTGVVRLKAVGCLDNCKRGPNLEIEGCLHGRCNRRDAAALIRQIAGTSGACPSLREVEAVAA